MSPFNDSIRDEVTLDEASQAAHSLAQYFDGSVILDGENEARNPLDTLSNELSNELLDSLEIEEWEPEAEPDDPVNHETPVPMLISLNQLRQWYVMARHLGHDDRLDRIIQLGQLFKQQFGDRDPDTPQPFTAWSSADVEIWLADLVNFQQQTSSSGKQFDPTSLS